MANPENEKKLKTRILVWFGTKVGATILRFCYNTNKWEHHGRKHFEKIIKNKKPVIVASWHSTLLTVFMGLSNKNYYGLAGNHHPDAEIISRNIHVMAKDPEIIPRIYCNIIWAEELDILRS